MTALHALLATLLIEVPLVVALFPRLSKRMALVALAANTATNLALNIGLPAVGIHGDARILAGELAALLVEAVVYALVSRDLPRSLVASAAGNLASFTLGGVLIHLIT